MSIMRQERMTITGTTISQPNNTIQPLTLQPFYNSGTTGPIGTNETPFEPGGTIFISHFKDGNLR